MDFLTNLPGWVQALPLLLWGLSEFLGSFDGVKANGVYQFFANGVKWLYANWKKK